MSRKPKKELARWEPILSESQTNLEIAFVIDQTNSIEYELKQIIAAYITKDKEKREFVSSILLHNTIVNLGTKFRLLQSIVEQEDIPKINDSNCFHRLVEIRNAFAHGDTVTHHLDVNDFGDGSAETKSYYLLNSVSSSGKLKEVTREEALSEFTQCLVTIRDYLVDVVHKKLNAKNTKN